MCPCGRIRERFVVVDRHTCMTRTTDLETVAMGPAEQELATQLAEAAKRMPLNPEALAEVRGRASTHRRVPVPLLVASAAAVLAVVALVGSIGRDAPPAEVESASGSSAPASASNPDDGALLVFDYPNSDDPGLAGEWTTLNTLTGSYHWRGGPDSLPRSEVNDEESRMAQFLDIIDTTGSAPADEVIGDVVAAAAGRPWPNSAAKPANGTTPTATSTSSAPWPVSSNPDSPHLPRSPGCFSCSSRCQMSKCGPSTPASSE